jgi:peptidoglycan/LPS O-acetylase OafA/YrhL
VSSSKHIGILDPMRGVAALAVVLFHFSGMLLPSITPNALTDPLWAGKLGVQFFFVISGFVIPYALFRSGYTLKGFWTFMGRRFVRIAPPAYIALLPMIVLHYLAVYFTGRGIEGSDYPGLNAASILGNLAFIPEYIGSAYFNFVYWTLTVEFEFYIVIALVFPLIAQGSPNWRIAAVLLGILALAAVLPEPKFMQHAMYFVLGVVVFLWQWTTADRTMLGAVAALAAAEGFLIGTPGAAPASLLAALIIFSRTTWRSAPTDWLGRISYSLYITHIPAGCFAEVALKRVLPWHTTPGGKLVMLVIYVVLALLVAWLFHRFLEKPFLLLSKRIGRAARTDGAT